MRLLLIITEKISQRKIFPWVIILFLGSVILIENPWIGQPSLARVTDGLQMIDMNYYNSPASITQYLRDLGSVGRSIYLRLLLFDNLLIIMLAAFSAGLIYRLVKANAVYKKWIWLILLPFYRGLWDFLETGAMMINVAIFPKSFMLTIYTAVISTPLKWLFFCATMLSILILWILYLIRNFYKRSWNGKSNRRATKTGHRNY